VASNFNYNKNNITAIIGFNSILADSSISKIALGNKIYIYKNKYNNNRQQI
jgi:hypothetical protein